MSANGAEQKREGLSVATLVIAAIASGAAAIVTSHFWHGGTIMTAAITPVIVALVKEGLQRPMQSEVVRRPVQRITETRTRTRAPARAYERVGAPDRPRREVPPPRRVTERHPLEPMQPTEPAMSPVATYGRRPRWHLRAAIVTGVIAFAIAAIVLTVPELVFGGSVAGHGSTTFFSTKSSSTKSGTSQNQKGKSSNGSSGNSNTDTTQTTPSQQPQGTQTSTTPQQQSPPSQAAPPSGGSTSPQPAPSTPTTP